MLQTCIQTAKQHTSSFSALPVLEWCLLCECFLHMHTCLQPHNFPDIVL